MERGGLSFFAPPLFLRCRPLRSLPLRTDSLISGQQWKLNSVWRHTPPPRLPRAGHSCTARKKGATAMMSPCLSWSWNLPGMMRGKKDPTERVWEAASCEITESSSQAQWPSLSHNFKSPAKSTGARSVEMSFHRCSLPDKKLFTRCEAIWISQCRKSYTVMSRYVVYTFEVLQDTFGV